jgi:hypothetical protein
MFEGSYPSASLRATGQKESFHKSLYGGDWTLGSIFYVVGSVGLEAGDGALGADAPALCAVEADSV